MDGAVGVGAVEVAESLSEDARVAMVASVQAGAPVDVAPLVAGSLAGPASPGRPPVPVWEYLDYRAEHPGLSLDELSAVRFPVVLHGGHTMVTSIAELVKPGPVSPTYEVTVGDVVRLYRLQYEAGALRWNADTLTHEETRPLADYRAAVYDRWREELAAKASGRE